MMKEAASRVHLYGICKEQLLLLLQTDAACASKCKTILYQFQAAIDKSWTLLQRKVLMHRCQLGSHMPGMADLTNVGFCPDFTLCDHVHVHGEDHLQCLPDPSYILY